MKKPTPLWPCHSPFFMASSRREIHPICLAQLGEVFHLLDPFVNLFLVQLR